MKIEKVYDRRKFINLVIDMYEDSKELMMDIASSFEDLLLHEIEDEDIYLKVNSIYTRLSEQTFANTHHFVENINRMYKMSDKTEDFVPIELRDDKVEQMTEWAYTITEGRKLYERIVKSLEVSSKYKMDKMGEAFKKLYGI